METVKENKMGTTPMLKLIISMSLPAMFSMLIQALYNIVDSMFVAQIGEKALSAVSLAFPIQMLLISVGVGTGVGINSLVSRRLGERRRDEASSAATHGIVLGLISWAVFAILGVCFTRMFFQMYTTDAELIQMGCDYLYIVTIFSFGSFVQINLEKALQATGNMIYPMLFQLTGAITNIILDPIMIFGLLGFPKMGVMGAAVATVIGQILAMVFAVIIAFVKNHEVHITFKNFRLNGKTIRDIYAVGVPSIIMQAIGSVLVTALNMILAMFSQTAVAVLGVYYKLQSFVFMPVFGLTQGVMPIMGYSYGARNKKRLQSARKICGVIAIVIMALGTALFWLAPEPLLGLFSPSADMIRIGVGALRTISLCFIPAALGITYSTLFQAIGKGVNSLIISVLRQLVVILPAAYLLSLIGLDFVWYAFPIAEGVSLVVSLLLYWRVYEKQIKNLTPLDPAH